MPALSKIEVADRQFNAGIELYFSSYDPLIPHALVAAALNIYTDLSQRKGTDSWVQKAATNSNLDLPAARKIFNRAWSFIKHADRDPEGTLDFDPSETEHLAMFATLERVTHGELTRHMEAFQYWYLAKHPVDADSDLVRVAAVVFPSLATLPLEEQLLAGKRYLEVYRET